MDPDETVTVIRVLVYTGPRKWIRMTLNKSAINPSLSDHMRDAGIGDLIGEIKEVFRSSVEE